MQKKPDGFAEKFHSIFTIQVQLAMIGGLVGVITMKLLGL